MLPQSTVYFLFSATYNEVSINNVNKYIKLNNIVHI